MAEEKEVVLMKGNEAIAHVLPTLLFVADATAISAILLLRRVK